MGKANFLLRKAATPLLSHFHTFTHFCMLNYLLKNFYPTFGQKYPVSYPFYPYFRPQKCRFSVGLKCKKWGARGDNNNLYICVIFFLAFSLFKKRESVKVWKWTDFFTFFYFFSRKICKHHNSHRNFAAQFKIIARSSHSHRITIAHTYTCSPQANKVFPADASR